ncbi:MAG: hypothetical protein ABIJ31_08380 [Pseudomonadota bacterium]
MSHPKKEKSQPDLHIQTKLTPFIKNNRIDCARAHQAARQLNIDPLEIGQQLDLLNAKIIHCQLGLFGYDTQKKQLDPTVQISLILDTKISAAQTDSRISCLKCWQLAKELSISRLDIASVCEKKGLKIKPCQLGAF